MSELSEVGEHRKGRQIELRPRRTLRVTLPEVRTAGFRWSLRTSRQHILVPQADDLHATPSAAGGAAQHDRDFRAEEAGTTELVFEYARPWARAAAAARTFSVSVRVADTWSDAAHQSA